MAKRFSILALAAFLALLTGCPKPPAADPTDAKRLVETGNDAAALARLLELSKADPENVEVRLLMAQALAKCDPKLKIPGLQSVGTNNAERAAYQLQILVRLGDAGSAALCKAISNGEEPLASMAIETAGNAGLKETVAAIRAFLKQGDEPPDAGAQAVRALARIGGRPALDAIKSYVDDAKGLHDQRGLGVTCMTFLDREDRLELVEKTKNQALLADIIEGFIPPPEESVGTRTSRSTRIRRHQRKKATGRAPSSHHAHEALAAIARRVDLGDDLRLRALRKLDDHNRPAFEKLAEELIQGKPDAVRRHALNRLAHIDPAKTIEPVIAVFLNQADVSQKEMRPLWRLVSFLAGPAPYRPANPRRVAVLERLLEAKSRRVRLFAAKELAPILPEKALGPLIAEYDCGNENPQTARRSEETPPDPIRARRDSAGWEHRRQALRYLTEMFKYRKGKDTAQFIAAVEAATKHPDKAINWPATQALYRLAPEKAFEPLAAALKSRGQGLYQIAELKTPKATKLLFEILETKSDRSKLKKWKVPRNDVARALVRSTASVADLIRAIHLTETLVPQPGCSYGFPGFWKEMKARRPKKELEHVALSLLAEKNVRLRRYGVHGLRILPMESRLKHALELLNDPDKIIRSRMWYIILEGKRLGLMTPEMFIPLLSHSDQNIVRHVAKVVSKKPVEAAREPMVKLLYDTKRSRYAMHGLAAFFKKIPDKRAAPIFEREIISGRPVATVEMLVGALKICSDDLPKSARTIVKALRSRSAWVRDRTIRALELLDQKAVVPDIVEALKFIRSRGEKKKLDRLIRRLGWTPPKPDSGDGSAGK